MVSAGESSAAQRSLSLELSGIAQWPVIDRSIDRTRFKVQLNLKPCQHFLAVVGSGSVVVDGLQIEPQGVVQGTTAELSPGKEAGGV